MCLCVTPPPPPLLYVFSSVLDHQEPNHKESKHTTSINPGQPAVQNLRPGSLPFSCFNSLYPCVLCVCVFCMFVGACVGRYTCTDGGPRLMSAEILLHGSYALFTEAGPLNRTQSSSIWLVWRDWGFCLCLPGLEL